RRGNPIPARVDFAVYLFGVGLVAALAYVASRSIEGGRVDRYLLLVLYAPIGLMAMLLALERRAAVRAAAVALAAVLACVSLIDHAALFSQYARGAEPDGLQVLADELVARGIRTAEAGYWRAYRTTFLAKERVKITATDHMRIEE